MIAHRACESVQKRYRFSDAAAMVNYATYAYSYYALVVFRAHYPETRHKTCALSRTELCTAVNAESFK